MYFFSLLEKDTFEDLVFSLEFKTLDIVLPGRKQDWIGTNDNKNLNNNKITIVSVNYYNSHYIQGYKNKY